MEEKISNFQVWRLQITIILPSLILLILSQVSSKARQIGWLSILLIGCTTLLLQYIVLKLSCNYSSDSIVVDCENLFGPIWGRIVIIPCFYGIITANLFIALQAFGFLKFIMKKAPAWPLWIGVGILIYYLVYTGLENIARVIGFVMPLVIVSTTISIIVLFVFYQSTIEFSRLQPLTIDFKRLLAGSLIPAVWFIELPVVFLILKPFYKDAQGAVTASLGSNLVNQVIFILVFIACIVVLGVELTSNLLFPYYQLMSFLVTGFEILLFTSWALTYILKLAIFCYSALQLLIDYFKLESNNLFAFSFVIFVIALAMFSNLSSVNPTNLAYNAFGYWSVIYLPTLILLSISYYLVNKN